ncbi:MAG: hypothetical protein B7X58_12105 [Marinobacter sp. 34-60-7]|nr:MAG: hypothetical protein B7X58_12105 [Marinobacter sp. 34-60-7]
MSRWALVAGLLLSGCSVADTQVNDVLPTTEACFVRDDGNGLRVTLEVASEPEQRRLGLMGRTELADHAGMLFSYGRERGANTGFWMYRTLIPLDIAFMRDDGTIVSINQMAPCADKPSRECPSYPAGARYTHAVEMNQGFFGENDITLGDRLVWPARGEC